MAGALATNQLLTSAPPMQADNIVTVVDLNNCPLVISHRLSAATTPPMEKVMPSHLTLQEIIIVGNCTDQV